VNVNNKHKRFKFSGGHLYTLQQTSKQLQETTEGKGGVTHFIISII